MQNRQTLSSRKQGSGRLGAALLLFLAAAALAVMAASAAQANASQMIGLDMTPASGHQTAAAGVNTCTEVDVGDSFEADVFATNLDSLTAYEFRIDFDPDVIQFDRESVGFNFFLAKDGGSAQFPLVEEESAGRWFIAAVDSRYPDSGSGTLARLRFTALKKGTSALSIAASPTAFGPRLTGAGGVSVGDENGDGIWDGQLSSGKVAAGVSCAGATPIVTPAPTHVPNKTPGPTSNGTAPDGGSGASPAPGGEDGGSTGGGGGSAGAPTETAPGFVENVGSGGGQSSPTQAPGNIQGPGDGGERDVLGTSNQGNSGGSSSSTTVVLLVIAAVLVVSGAAALLWLRRSAGGAA